jgi:hypothetical protein
MASLEILNNISNNIDSPCVWHGMTNNHWIIATSKSTDALFIYDASTGKLLKKIGSSGSGMGNF